MSANFGRRIYAHFWESTHPFLGRIRPNRVPASNASSRKAFDSFGATPRRFSTPTGKYSPLTRRFASGSLLVLVSPTSAAAETGAVCILPSKTISAQYLWKRAIHSGNKGQAGGSHSDVSRSQNENDRPSNVHNAINPPPPNSPKSQPPDPQIPKPSNRHLMDRLPHMPHLHRPTKEELLAAATGFWSRLKVRFKWFSIRSVRPFNLDEITALFSWVLLGHVVWVVLGTTTFFSLLILAINTVFAQGMYMSRSRNSETKLLIM